MPTRRYQLEKGWTFGPITVSDTPFDSLVSVLECVTTAAWDDKDAGSASITVKLNDEPALYDSLRAQGYELTLPKKVGPAPIAVSLGSLTACSTAATGLDVAERLQAVAALDTALDPYCLSVTLRSCGPSATIVTLELDPRVRARYAAPAGRGALVRLAQRRGALGRRGDRGRGGRRTGGR